MAKEKAKPQTLVKKTPNLSGHYQYFVCKDCGVMGCLVPVPHARKD